MFHMSLKSNQPCSNTMRTYFLLEMFKIMAISKRKIIVPVCKNGIEMEKIIRLYVQNANFDDNLNDLPKQERIIPQTNRNRPSFVYINITFINLV